MLCLSSCITEEANYYVKYEATITSIYYGAEVNYVVTTENGTQTITTDSKILSEVFGPVQKGFTASIFGKTSVFPWIPTPSMISSRNMARISPVWLSWAAMPTRRESTYWHNTFTRSILSSVWPGIADACASPLASKRPISTISRLVLTSAT